MTFSTNSSAVLDSYPGEVRRALLRLRDLIHETAGQNSEIGQLEEALKWGQPSFLTVMPQTGTAIRIDRDISGQGDFALFVNCQTSLVSEWRAMFPHLTYGGNRSVHFTLAEPLPEDELRQMITMALTYRSRKRKPAAKGQPSLEAHAAGDTPRRV